MLTILSSNQLERFPHIPGKQPDTERSEVYSFRSKEIEDEWTQATVTEVLR